MKILIIINKKIKFIDCLLNIKIKSIIRKILTFSPSSFLTINSNNQLINE